MTENLQGPAPKPKLDRERYMKLVNVALLTIESWRKDGIHDSEMCLVRSLAEQYFNETRQDIPRAGRLVGARGVEGVATPGTYSQTVYVDNDTSG